MKWFKSSQKVIEEYYVREKEEEEEIVLNTEPLQLIEGFESVEEKYEKLATRLKIGLVAESPSYTLRRGLRKLSIPVYPIEDVTKYLNQKACSYNWHWWGLRDEDREFLLDGGDVHFNSSISPLLLANKLGWNQWTYNKQYSRDSSWVFIPPVYKLPIPYPALLTVEAISKTLPNAKFFISHTSTPEERAVYSESVLRLEDPFLAVAVIKKGSDPSMELMVVERWDEPSFRIKE
jgi:hypothetical protein